MLFSVMVDTIPKKKNFSHNSHENGKLLFYVVPNYNFVRVILHTYHKNLEKIEQGFPLMRIFSGSLKTYIKPSAS